VSPFETLDLEAIDLLAPEIERFDNEYERQLRMRRDFPHCPTVLNQFFWLVENFGFGHKLLVTQGSIGFGPLDAREGDLVYSLAGTDVPLVVRREGRRFILVGECIVLQESVCDCDISFSMVCECAACSTYRSAISERSKIRHEILSLS